MKMNKRTKIIIGAAALGLIAIYYLMGSEATGAAAVVIALGQQRLKREKRKIVERKKPENDLQNLSDEITEARKKAREEKEKWLDRRF